MTVIFWTCAKFEFSRMHGDQICLDQRLFVLNVVTSDLSSAVYIDMYLVIAFTLFAIVMQADSVIISCTC